MSPRRLAVPCITCNQPTRHLTQRCTTCNLNHYGTQTGTPTHQETQRRKTLLTNHINQHGDTCPGYNTPPHPTNPTNPLTADHTTPRSHKGDNTPLTPLCRACNSRRQAGR